MKRILSVLLVLCFLMSFCACHQENDDHPSNETTGDQNEAILNEEDQIKQTVLNLMKKSDEQKDPASLFAFFDGDFEISNFSSSMDGIQTIKRKNAVSQVSANGVRYYGVEAAGFLFYTADSGNESDVIAFFPLQTDASEKSTVFTVFGIDTSAIYGEEVESEPLELTADMLTVSSDKASCTFSKAYVDGIAKNLCEIMGYTKAQTDQFLKEYIGSGVYSIAENKITFDIQFEDRLLGKINQITSYSIDSEEKVSAYSYMEYSNPTLGIKTPLTSEIQYRDVVYKGNEPISASIKLRSVQDRSFYDGEYQEKVFISAIEDVTTTFTLDCSNASAPKGSVSCQKKITESFQGELYTNQTALSLSIDLGKTSSQFTFSEKRDGEVITSLKANKVSFSTPTSFQAVPQRVTNAITNYINKHF